MFRLKDFDQLIFYLILFFLPSGLAKHWPQSWSYVNGVLVDYLIPAVYLTDILVFLLLGFWLVKNRPFKKQGWLKLGLAILPLAIINTWLAKNPLASTYKWLKVLEIGLFSYYVKTNINIKKDIKNISLVLSLAIIWQSLLSWGQWFNQGGVFGYWFLGEQTYTQATPGIKLISWAGQLRVLPMATFSHPNVLAGFLALFLPLSFTSLVSGWSKKLSLNQKIILVSGLVLGSGALFLTFSLPAWTVFSLFFGWRLSQGWFKTSKGRQRLVNLFGLGFLILVFSWLVFSVARPSFYLTSLSRRRQLAQISLKTFFSAPLLGVGLNNFVVSMEDFGQVVASYRFLQPVHNIFLLVLSETGLLGAIAAGWLLSASWRQKKKAGNRRPFGGLSRWLAASTFFLGLFDHYLLSLQQGMLMTALILGF